MASATYKAKGFNPGGGSGSYAYDVNGNLTTDPYKAMTVQYNHLNLPKKMTFGNDYIEITYDAAGTKLRKVAGNNAILTGGGGTEKSMNGKEGEEGKDDNAPEAAASAGPPTNYYTHDYLGGIEYRDGVREAIYTAEGRLFNNAGTNRYEYTIKDHLGNARISFTDKNGNNTIEYSNGEVLQENHYYPFGLAYEGPWVNDAARDNMYQYNGKEINDDFGLNLNDYGARWYDASVGRFLAVDKFADGYVGFSPFSYVANNPLKFIDVNGDYIDIYNPQGEFVMSIDDGKKKAVGLYFKQSCIDDNGKEKFSNGIAFEYNDEKEDRENATKNGFIVKESSDKDIQSAVMQGTLDAFRNSENSIKYVERESRPKGDESVLSGKSEGKLDYFGSYPDVAPGVVLQIVVNKKGNKAVAYNPKDYGNFLWGRSVKFLGLPYSFAKAGSQLNNIFNSGSDNPSLDREFLDSEGDQRAIYNGYYHHVKEPKNGINADQYKSGIK